MAYGCPPWAIGRNVTIQITPQSCADDGTLSANAIGALTFNGRLDEDSQELEYTVENISPRDAYNSNPVAIEVGSTFTITEIAQAWSLWSNNTAVWGAGNTLEKAARLSEIHLIQISMLDKGLDTTLFSWTAYVRLIRHGRTSPKGKGNYNATFQTILVADTSTGTFQSNPSVG